MNFELMGVRAIMGAIEIMRAMGAMGEMPKLYY